MKPMKPWYGLSKLVIPAFMILCLVLVWRFPEVYTTPGDGPRNAVLLVGFAPVSALCILEWILLRRPDMPTQRQFALVAACDYLELSAYLLTLPPTVVGIVESVECDLTQWGDTQRNLVWLSIFALITLRELGKYLLRLWSLRGLPEQVQKLRALQRALRLRALNMADYRDQYQDLLYESRRMKR